MGPETFFRLLLATLQPGVPRTFVDVGANQGAWSLIAAKHGLRVIAFEPLPNNVAAFHRNVPPSLYPHVRLINKGVGDASRVAVHMRGNSKGSRRGVASGTSVDVGAMITAKCDPARTKCLDVALTTIDAEVTQPVFAMKLDIQGYETHALRGARQLIRERGVDVLIIEFDPRLQDAQGGSCVTILNELHSAGYVLFENSRLGFDRKFTKLTRNYHRNWGAPMAFEAYVNELRKEASYTDMIAMRAEMVAYPSFFA